MHVKRSHRDEEMLAEAIAQATHDERIKSYFTRRFLEYLRWLEDGSASNLIAYYGLRIPAIVLAALVPALVALNLGSVGRVITVILGVIVAAATAVEHFLTSGQRWRHYRGSVELMKSEGWLYLELAGPYSNLGSLEAAFPTFVGRVETLMRDEVNELRDDDCRGKGALSRQRRRRGTVRTFVACNARLRQSEPALLQVKRCERMW